jgi:hypothetical protein
VGRGKQTVRTFLIQLAFAQLQNKERKREKKKERKKEGKKERKKQTKKQRKKESIKETKKERKKTKNGFMLSEVRNTKGILIE